MKRIRTIIMNLAVTAGFTALVLAPVAAYADGASCSSPTDCISSGVTATGGSSSGGTDLKTFIKNIVNVLLFVLGAIAVIMIIIGGIRYTTSNGDSGQVTSAKNTIMYAVVGLVVAIMAYAIVNFVVSSFKGTS